MDDKIDRVGRMHHGLGLHVVRVFDVHEKRALQQAWRRVFAQHVHMLTGRWVYKGRDWHAFSYGSLWRGKVELPWEKLLDGNDAITAYMAAHEPEGSLIVIPDEYRYPAFECSEMIAPNLESLFVDVTVVPPDMRWSMSFTHDGHGPYYTITFIDPEADPMPLT